MTYDRSMSKVQRMRSVGLLAGAVLLLAACGGGDDSTAAPVTTEPAATEEPESEQADPGAEEQLDPCDLVDEELITAVVGEEVTDVSRGASGGLYEGVAIGAEQCSYEYGDPVQGGDDPEMIEARQSVSVGVVVDEAGDPDLAAWEEFSQSVSDSIGGEAAVVLGSLPEIEELGDEVATHDGSVIIRDGGTTYRFGYEADTFSDGSPMEIGEGEIADFVAMATEVLASDELASANDCAGLSTIAESVYDDVEDIGFSMGGGTPTVDGEQLEYEMRTCTVSFDGTSARAEVTMSDDEDAFEAMSSYPPVPEMVDDLGDGAYLTEGSLFLLDGERFLIFGDSTFGTITDDQLVELARLVVGN